MKKFQVDLKVSITGTTPFNGLTVEGFSLGMCVPALNAYDASVLAYRRVQHDFGSTRTKVTVNILKVEEVEHNAEESE